MVFWRILHVELWLRAFIDQPATAEAERPPKPDLEPNQDKKLTIEVGEATYARYPLQTKAVQAEDDLTQLVVDRVRQFGRIAPKGELAGRWYLFISEKIVAITQGRSYFIWDVHPNFWPRMLSRFVVRTSYGIGLGSPWTMQLAIQEAGLPRILFAAAGSVIGKLFGKRGVFYNLVGSNVRAIDGPTEYSVYPSNVSAKLPPARPNMVAKELHEAIAKKLSKDQAAAFGGVVVMDANDIGRNVLGQDSDMSDNELAAIFADNPLGQGSERTPLCIVVRRGEH